MQRHRCALRFLVKTILQRPRSIMGRRMEVNEDRSLQLVSVCVLLGCSLPYTIFFVLFCCLAMMTHYLFWYEKSTVYPIESVTDLHIVGEQTYRQ